MNGKILITENEREEILKLHYNAINKEISEQLKINTNITQQKPDNEKIKCYSEVEPLFNKAINYWKEWINHPTTIEKFKNNFGYDDSKVKTIFDSYIDTLNKLELVVYNDNDIKRKILKFKTKSGRNESLTIDGEEKDDYAFVINETRYIFFVFVNCSSGDEDVYGTLIHEIQHSLYNRVHPLNSDQKIKELFVGPNTKKDTPATLFKQNSKVNSKIISGEMNFSKIETEKIMGEWTRILNKTLSAGVSREYICSETEKMSNIQSIRNILNLKPGENITIEMLRPHILFEAEPKEDIFFFFMCWAANNFPSLNNMINNLNQLANKNIQKNKQSPTNFEYNQNQIKNV